MAESAQERTEQATPKRLEEARRKGQIPRSRDLSAAAVTLAGGTALYMMGGQIGGALHGMMSRGLTLTREQALDSAYLLPALADAAAAGLRACAPVLGVIMLAAILAPLALGGWSFSTAVACAAVQPVESAGRRQAHVRNAQHHGIAEGAGQVRRSRRRGRHRALE